MMEHMTATRRISGIYLSDNGIEAAIKVKKKKNSSGKAMVGCWLLLSKEIGW
jgi:hypothetical protein